MATASHASASDPLSLEGLPLIFCPECKVRRMVRRTSKQPWSLGQVFFCCPSRKPNGIGCAGFYWKEEYVALLEKRVESSLKKVAGFGGDGDPKMGDTLAAALKEIEQMKQDRDMVASVKDLVNLGKATCVLLLCILFVLLLSLFVELVKR